MVPYGGHCFRFCNLRLLGNGLPRKSARQRVLLGRTTMGRLGVSGPVNGALDHGSRGKFVVSNVFGSFCVTPPAIPMGPIVLRFDPKGGGVRGSCSAATVFQRRPKDHRLYGRRIRRLTGGVRPGTISVRIAFVRRRCRGFLGSRGTLLGVLSFIAVIYVLVSLFNMFSRMALSYRRGGGRVTIHGMGKTRTSSVVEVFFTNGLHLLYVTSIVTFPTDCLVVGS